MNLKAHIRFTYDLQAGSALSIAAALLLIENFGFTLFRVMVILVNIVLILANTKTREWLRKMQPP